MCGWELCSRQARGKLKAHNGCLLLHIDKYILEYLREFIEKVVSQDIFEETFSY